MNKIDKILYQNCKSMKARLVTMVGAAKSGIFTANSAGLDMRTRLMNINEGGPWDSLGTCQFKKEAANEGKWVCKFL